MNMFRREKGPTTPVVPPRPSKEDLDHPVEYGLPGPDAGSEVACELNPKTKRTGVMGVVHKVNPFKSTSQAPSIVVNAASTESPEPGAEATQNPGMLRGVMQKVNPFKSSSPAPRTVGQAASSESPGPDPPQSPGVLRGVMQKVNPFKSASQVSKAASSESLEAGRVPDSGQRKLKGAMQTINPFKSPAQAPRSDPRKGSADPPETGTEPNAKLLHADLSSSSGSLTDGKDVPEKQSPGMFRGMMQKVNPFRSYAQKPDEECESDSASSLVTQENRSVATEMSSSSDSADEGDAPVGHTIWYADHEVERPLKKRATTFRIRRILPAALFGSKDSSPDTQAPPPEL